MSRMPFPGLSVTGDGQHVTHATLYIQLHTTVGIHGGNAALDVDLNPATLVPRLVQSRQCDHECMLDCVASRTN
jgi:hypothetical protein